MKTKTYSITPEKAAAAAAELKAAEGIDIDPNQSAGTVEVHGVHLVYTRQENQLQVTIQSRPFYIPEAAIWAPLDKAFN